MTRKGAAKSVNKEFAAGRLRNARAFMKSAEDSMTIIGQNEVGNPVMSQIINAAIAFTDAITAKYAQQVNQQDHAAAVKTLRAAIGNRLTTTQETNLRRILSEKDDVQYGDRARTQADAQAMLEKLKSFAEWAEAEMARP